MANNGRFLNIKSDGTQIIEAAITQSAGTGDAAKIVATNPSGKIAKSLLPPTMFEFVQATLSPIWTINHNFGSRPIVQVYSIGGQSVVCDITHISINQLTCSFSTPFSGYAELTIPSLT